MLKITVRSAESIARLRKFAAVMRPEQTALNNRKAGIAMHTDVIRTFRAQGATDGRALWKPLKAGGRYTGTGKLRKDGSRAPRRFQTAYQILQDTGALRNSFVPLSDSSVAGVGAASVKGHSDLAPLHERGNTDTNLPARPMLTTEARAISIITEIYGLAIEKAARP